MAEHLDRCEKIRADWLLAHEAGWHLSDRRMATRLKRKAAEKDRAAAGAAESPHHEGRIKPLHVRFVAGGEDSRERMLRGLILVLLLVPTTALWLGPALAFSYAACTVAVETTLRRGTAPRRKPWLLAAGVAAAGGPAVALAVQEAATLATVRVWPEWVITLHWGSVLAVYGWLQLTLGLAATAWQIRRHGWPGVKAQEKPTVPTVPTVPSVPDAGEPAAAAARVTDQPTDHQPAAPKAPQAPAIPAAPSPDSADEPEDESEDEPVFDDEPVLDDEVVFDDHHEKESIHG